MQSVLIWSSDDEMTANIEERQLRMKSELSGSSVVVENVNRSKVSWP